MTRFTSTVKVADIFVRTPHSISKPSAIFFVLRLENVHTTIRNIESVRKNDIYLTFCNREY